MVIVFAHIITTRLTYIVTTLFGTDAVITNNINQFNHSSLQKINYTANKIDDCNLWIEPYGLLEQETVETIDITCFEWNGLKVFFKTNGQIPFDIFSAAFYLLSRYEEYSIGYTTDNYGNYHHKNSLAYKNNFLQLPLINLWLQQIEKQFNFQLQASNFKIIPTYDVDIAFAYKHHSLVKNIGGFIKDVLQQRGTFKERLLVLLNYKKDVYDVFDVLQQLHGKYNLQPIYFFLVAQSRSQFDKNAIPKSKGMKMLIHQLAAKNKIGIHPSFSSNSNENILHAEIEDLQKISSKKINISRQHYLQLSFPKTYKTLMQQGIEEDYTMGYGTHNGFRASYCKSFYWYNLTEEKTTNLLLHPFCYMDSNSIFEQQLTAENALQEMQYYYNIVKQVNGNLIVIMHNHFLANQQKWQQWRNTYEQFLKLL